MFHPWLPFAQVEVPLHSCTDLAAHRAAAKRLAPQRKVVEGRGYQPMVTVWAEADLAVADEFRDGNVPAKQDPLRCAKLAFAALPETITQRYFRGGFGRP